MGIVDYPMDCPMVYLMGELFPLSLTWNTPWYMPRERGTPWHTSRLVLATGNGTSHRVPHDTHTPCGTITSIVGQSMDGIVSWNVPWALSNGTTRGTYRGIFHGSCHGIRWHIPLITFFRAVPHESNADHGIMTDSTLRPPLPECTWTIQVVISDRNRAD